MLKLVCLFLGIIAAFHCNEVNTHPSSDELVISVFGKYNLEEVTSILPIDKKGLDSGISYYIVDASNSSDSILLFPSLEETICYFKAIKLFIREHDRFIIPSLSISEYPASLSLVQIKPRSSRKFILYIPLSNEIDILYLEFYYSKSLTSQFSDYKTCKVFFTTKEGNIVEKFSPPIDFWDKVVWE